MLLSNIFLKHLVFFLVGIVQDILATYYYQTISKEYYWRATILSFVVTLANLLILYKILTGIEDQVLSVVLIYALGNGVGTLIVMRKHRIKKALTRKKKNSVRTKKNNKKDNS